ncbi:MAG: nitroreductase family protein [Methanosphaera sp.]|nr:nitroreductase family protein [Methanosphaera sp.]
MNDSDLILDSINSRCSTRRFSDKKISEENLDKIIRSAFCAPSACNLQPWEFIVITDEDRLNDMTKVHPYASMFKTATAGIIVCGDMEKCIEGHEEFWVQDCSASTENILLAANSLEIGSVWTGIYPVMERCDFLSEYFNLPDNITPFSLIALGYPNENKNIMDKYDRMKVHREKW